MPIADEQSNKDLTSAIKYFNRDLYFYFRRNESTKLAISEIRVYLKEQGFAS